MPDLDHYRRRYPELSEEEIETLHWTLKGMARETVTRYRSGEDLPSRPEVACPPK